MIRHETRAMHEERDSSQAACTRQVCLSRREYSVRQFSFIASDAGRTLSRIMRRQRPCGLSPQKCKLVKYQLLKPERETSFGLRESSIETVPGDREVSFSPWLSRQFT